MIFKDVDKIARKIMGWNWSSKYNWWAKRGVRATRSLWNPSHNTDDFVELLKKINQEWKVTFEELEKGRVSVQISKNYLRFECIERDELGALAECALLLVAALDKQRKKQRKKKGNKSS